MTQKRGLDWTLIPYHGWQEQFNPPHLPSEIPKCFTPHALQILKSFIPPPLMFFLTLNLEFLFECLNLPINWNLFPLQENSAHNIWSSPQLTQFVMMFNKVHRNFPFYVVSLSCLPPIFFFVFSSLALYFQEWRVDHNENLVLIPVVRRPN